MKEEAYSGGKGKLEIGSPGFVGEKEEGVLVKKKVKVLIEAPAHAKEDELEKRGLLIAHEGRKGATARWEKVTAQTGNRQEKKRETTTMGAPSGGKEKKKGKFQKKAVTLMGQSKKFPKREIGPR